MGILMDISKYGVKYDDPLEYDDEVIYSGWIPAMAMASSSSRAGSSMFQQIPLELSAMDMEGYLQDMYVGME